MNQFSNHCRLWGARGGVALLLVVSCGVNIRGRAENAFAQNIRTTPPLTPQEEQKALHVPPGFEVQLVAAEPEVVKPINIAFDAKGRLWVTESQEYPIPRPIDQPGRDKIKVLSRFDRHGRAHRVTTFAYGLHIPIGLYPYRDGVIAYAIPNIYFFHDTNGDGHADSKEVLLGKFGYDKDTHGMTSNFRRGYDGWLYADHGFNNTSVLTAKDGSSITLNSGNTYRFRIDGSQVEHFTWGMVNPFGLMFDPRGDLYASDCETKPVYILLRGAYYPSFGKPDDGLGFAPRVMRYMHGSTAIAGMVYYAATNFPPAYRGNTYVGNVVTCRINRDGYTRYGSTPVSHHEPDFVVSDDPWFRPVNLLLGPDGALYVADFYDRIIGEYEVSRTDPRRDHVRGRIWRIVYRGGGKSSAAHGKKVAKEKHSGGLGLPDFTAMDTEALIAALADPNITVRMLAMNQLTDRIGKAAIPAIRRMMGHPRNTFQRVHGLWLLYRFGVLDFPTLAEAARDPEALVRIHAMRILSETVPWTPEQRALALAGLKDPNADVERAAADAMGQHPAYENIRPLLDLRHRAPAQDALLVHVTRMALRNQLLPAGMFGRLPLKPWSEADERAIADVALGAHSAGSAAFLLDYIRKYSEDRVTTQKDLRFIARYAPVSDLEALAKFTRRKFADDLDFQLALFQSIEKGITQRGATPRGEVRDWGADLAQRLVASVTRHASAWRNIPVEGKTQTRIPWFLQQRVSSDGNRTSTFVCSLPPGGESLTGILRSKPFMIPSRLSFYMAGHDGFPNHARLKKNLVRLRDADTGKVLARTYAPRNDTAQRVIWDLASVAGRRGYLEIVDRDDGPAYAWIAFGRLKPQVVPLPRIDPSKVGERVAAAANLAVQLKLAHLEKPLADLLKNPAAGDGARAAAAKALVALDPAESVETMGPILSNATASASLREAAGAALAQVQTPEVRSLFLKLFRTASRPVQLAWARALAGNAAGAETLLEAAEKGIAYPRLLLDGTVQEKLTTFTSLHAKERIKRLTRYLPPVSVATQKLIAERRRGYRHAKRDPRAGAKVFEQNCSICHQINGKGGSIGPELDGIGNRGVDRLCEDVLDPSRHVDPAFRTRLVILKDGDVTSGLFRREEGDTIVLAESTGKEISIPKAQIQSWRPSQSSLMPDNFGQIIPEKDFYNLMAFLIDQARSSN